MNKAYFGPAFVALMLLCVFGYFGLCRQTRGTNQTPKSIITFYGRILDQNGNPLSAEVELQVSEMAPDSANFVASGAIAKKLGAKTVVRANENGDFSVTISPPNHLLEVLEVRLSGYTWLKDWAWFSGMPEQHPNEMRQFEFAAPHSSFPLYTSESDNPAIFVLVKDGFAAKIIAKPSRGGSDRLRDGSTVVNKPFIVAIPSTGPDAPQGDEAINLAIKRYVDSRNAGRQKSGR